MSGPQADSLWMLSSFRIRFARITTFPPGTTLKSHSILQRQCVLHPNEEKRPGVASRPRYGLRSGGDETNGPLLYRSSQQSVGRASSSIICSRQTLDRVGRAERGTRNSRYRSYCCGGASRIRRAIFGWPAAAEGGD